MAASTTIIRVRRPFSAGVQDYPTDERSALELEDAVMPLGVVCKRGGWDHFSAANPFGDGADVVASTRIKVPNLGNVQTLVVGGGARLGLDTGTETTLAAPFVGPIPGVFRIGPTFNGEQLLLPEDGESPILRWKGVASGAAQITFAAGTGDWVSRTGTNITLSTSLSASLAATDVGRYVTSRYEPGSRILTAWKDANEGHISSPFWYDNDSGGYVSDCGRLGLMTKVTDKGMIASIAVGTVTGTGTLWDQAPVLDSGRPDYYGFGDVASGDFFVILDGGDNGVLPILLSVTNNNTLLIPATTPLPADTTDVSYVISRPLVGNVANVHEGRLYVCGVAWAPRRLQVSPPLWNGETPENGEFSFDVDAGRASLIGDVEVTTAGELNGLMTLPSGNQAVLTTVDAFVSWGQYPALNFEKVGDMGNFGGYSTLVVDDGAWFAGPEGVYEFRGNTPTPITNEIDSRWRRIVGEVVTDCFLGMYRDHLLVIVITAVGTRRLVWSRRQRVWVSTDWSLPDDITHLASTRIAGDNDRLLMAYDNSTRVADLSTCFVDHETDITETSNPGTFRGVTGDLVAGDLSSDKEVKYVKLEHQLISPDGLPELEITAGPYPSSNDPIDPKGQATSGEETASTIGFPPTTPGQNPNGLGERTRRFNLEVTEDAGVATVTRLAVHEIEYEVKEYRRRG